MKPLRSHYTRPHAQHGAAMMVMLVIMILGTVAFLITSLSKVTLGLERNKQSSDILVQTKETLIGYLLSSSGGHPPGLMVPPDVLDFPSPSEKSPTTGLTASNYDGAWESNCLDGTNVQVVPPYAPLTASPLTGNDANKRCFGRLPWESLGMSISTPSENDPTGAMPWYAFSRNLISSGTATINSELLNANPPPYPWLKVYDMNGALLSDRVAFVIIVPGVTLPYQSRPPSPNLANPDQYLDKISVPAGCSPSGTPCSATYSNFDLTEKFAKGDEIRWMNDPGNPGKQIEDPTYQFNDKLLYVTIDELMPLLEKRVAREVKACLDDYAFAAGNTNHKYPWAAPVSSYPSHVGTFGTRFGRFPDIASTATNSSIPTADDIALQNEIITLQTALTKYINGAGTLSNLRNKGDDLKDFARDPPYNQSTTDPARAAGIYADNCTGMSCTGTLTTMVNDALSAIPGAPDTTMPAGWAVSSCTDLIGSSYWNDWRDLVFYQIADGYQPGSAGVCVSCLSISGSGNSNAGTGAYRASVTIAGKMVGAQARTTAANMQNRNNYLDGLNPTNKTDVPTSTTYETYKSSDANYQSITNDLVVCVDGKINCK
jgi:hypothetical protein